MIGGCDFDGRTHTYWKAGKRIPGFHEVIARFGYDDTKRFLDPEYLVRGTAVHEGIRLKTKGTLDWTTVHHEIIPYLEAHDKFVKDMQFVSVHSEAIAYHNMWKYACRLDDFGLFSLTKQHAIVEYKTGSVPKWTNLQTIAQLLAMGDEWLGLSGIHVPDVTRLAVELHDDGTYRPQPFDDWKDQYLWESLMALWNHQANLGYKMFKENREGLHE